MVEQTILDLGERIDALLTRHVPRPDGAELGLTCVRRQLQSRTGAEGAVVERWSFDALDLGLAQQFPYNGAYGYQPVLFKVTLNADGEPRFNNFVTSYFPHLRASWRKMIATEANLGATAALPMHLQTPNRWQHLDELLGHFAAALDSELGELGLATTPYNRARLTSVRLALGGGLMRGRQAEEALSADFAQWLAADIDLPVLVYAFGNDGYRYGSTSNPRVPFEDALELRGVPLARVRALYPPEEVERRW